MNDLSTAQLQNYQNGLFIFFVQLPPRFCSKRLCGVYQFVETAKEFAALVGATWIHTIGKNKEQNGKNTNDKIRKTEQQPQKQSPAFNLASPTIDVLQKFWRDVQVQLCSINFTIATEPNGTDCCSHCAYCVSVVLLSNKNCQTKQQQSDDACV
ncbi:conserved hypothetical protein [Trichinella spiralis]|uniref:hypothetical protein n=1 Tax=Trichinella spiralis TaxID=6334 RepID=UPI0001EFE579|nr:hypothetical protein Tsp_04926 [Trichinella spiralis]XP_003369521.1 conserved hypothetical protein [Trichinella spiralis]